MVHREGDWLESWAWSAGVLTHLVEFTLQMQKAFRAKMDLDGMGEAEWSAHSTGGREVGEGRLTALGVWRLFPFSLYLPVLSPWLSCLRRP